MRPPLSWQSDLRTNRVLPPITQRTGTSSGSCCGRSAPVLALRSAALFANLGAEAIWKAARRDKKARRGEIRCVLLRGMGEAARSDDGWTFPVERDELVQAIEAA